MSDSVYSKIIEIFEPIIRPRSSIFVFCIISGGILWDPADLQNSWGLEDDVKAVRSYLIGVFVVTSGLLIAGLLTGLLSWMRKSVGWITKCLSGKIQLHRIELSRNAEILLHLLYSQRPDLVSMKAKHPVVRELRRANLVKTGFVSAYSDYNHFWLTDLGEAVFKKQDYSFIADLPEGDIYDFYNEVCEGSWSAVRQRNWS